MGAQIETPDEVAARESAGEARFLNQTPGEVAKAASKVAAKTDAGAPLIALPKLSMETMLVPLRGTAPLIVHKFSEKAKKAMLDAMQGRKTPKTPKDPEAEYQASFYHIQRRSHMMTADGHAIMENDGYGFPVIAFKAATIGGARYYSGVTMTGLRQFLFFGGEIGDGGQKMARIVDRTPPRMREDVVRVNRGGSDLRYRPEFVEWGTTLQVTYITSALTRESVLALIEAGGLGVGVGEWRPEKGGDFGTYEIDQERDIQILD